MFGRMIVVYVPLATLLNEALRLYRHFYRHRFK